MAKAVIAVGSNLGDRNEYLHEAGRFLDALSDKPAVKSSIWESEPVGPAVYPFLNAAALIETTKRPAELLTLLKQFERKHGRDKVPERWRPRTLDLDIILYNHLVIQGDTLIIPHPEYQTRLFVLLPIEELLPEHADPVTGLPLSELIQNAPKIEIRKTDFTW